jgi:DeoR/GlpR family transcriptional regulator of sugar metabolism
VVKITDIAARFGISHQTARRDLDVLQDQGLACRVYGGAVLAEQSGDETVFPPKSRAVDGTLRQARLSGIAREAVRLIHEGDRLMLGNGIVVEEIARRLCDFRRLSIVTGSLAAANMLLNSVHEIYVLGGQMNHDERTLSGSYALQMARDFHVNCTIVPCGGLSVERGVMSDNLPAAELGRIALENAEKRVVLCGSDQFGKVMFHTVCPLSMVDVIITDEGIQKETKEELEARGVRVIVAAADM